MSKFNALVHFIVHLCSSDPKRLGATRLNKTLWFAEMYSYQFEGHTITEEKYVKRQYGPVPKSILPALAQLERDGLIETKEPDAWSPFRLFVSLREPDPSLLTDSDQTWARLALKEMMGLTAHQASKKTHDANWEAAAMGEEIPFCATLALPGKVTEDAMAWANDHV